jgi:hypothetical protein
MSPRPTGRLLSTAAGADLVLERSFRAPIADVWCSVTEPDSMSRWFGTWSGESGPGKCVTLQMGFEKDAPPAEQPLPDFGDYYPAQRQYFLDQLPR